MWAQIINAALGIWLMAAPAVWGYGPPAAANDRICGPLIATFAIISWWGVTRSVARWNLPLGLWLLLAPWVLGYSATAATVNSLVTGVLVAVLSLVLGTVSTHFGGGWDALRQNDPMHLRAHEERRAE